MEIFSDIGNMVLSNPSNKKKLNARESNHSQGVCQKVCFPFEICVSVMNNCGINKINKANTLSRNFLINCLFIIANIIKSTII